MKNNTKLSRTICSLILISTACSPLFGGAVSVGDYDLISNSSNLISVRSNHSTSNVLKLEDSTTPPNNNLGSIEAHSNGTQFGLKSYTGSWLLRSDYGTDVQFSVGSTVEMKLTPTGLNITDRQILFGNTSAKLNTDASAGLRYYSNNSNDTKLELSDKEGTRYGSLWGQSNGNFFGLRDADNNWSIFSSKDAYIQFRIDNSIKMHVDSEGEVGIGTTNPQHKLEVAGTGKFDGELTIPPGGDLFMGSYIETN
ncbi:hypothetical protein [Rubellicoccus peritrichatus]|uniref:Uncharacterized protein n=1 Tax=Rubellicoccus peritrichatus TaxID=3080537 RepID=A0AAQ3QTN0_9BACT|nr:hypothetical protein [Puniceicoccus sp. CR14]WOO41506.1 hypothetical protein RZN69_00295 [Puniceicoccus sp. CR14]